MPNTPYNRTATGQFITTPGTIGHVLVTARTDEVDVSFYDSSTSSSSDSLIGRLKVGVGASEFCLWDVRVYKGLYVVLNSGTTPDMFAYVR